MKQAIFLSTILESIIDIVLESLNWIDVVAVVLGLVYVVLTAKGNIWCWPFGIAASSLTMYSVAVYYQLYSEAILQVYYIGMGVFGWIGWKKGQSNDNGELEILSWSVSTHLKLGLVGCVLIVLLGYLMQVYLDAGRPFLDAFTTVFALIATWLTAKRVLENWLYWIVIDSVSIYLYASRGGWVFTVLFTIYTIMACYGWWKWRRLR